MQTAPISIDRIWEEALEELGYADSALVGESDFDPFRRTYVVDGQVLKIVLHDYEISGHLRRNTPQDEYSILERLHSVRVVPKPLGLEQAHEMSVLRMEHCGGRSLEEVEISRWRAVKALGRLTGGLFAISLRGIAHNDLKPDNILVDDASVTLLDFDQASTGSIGMALASNFAPRSRGDVGRFGSLPAIALFLAIRTMPRLAAPHKKVRAALRSTRNALRRKESLHSIWPNAEALNSERLRDLAVAWRMGAASSASSPGTTIAYYSLEFDGVRFPGERNWEQRWSYLRDATRYSGKRVLELGCNLGLLSTWVLHSAGADAVLGVDHNPDIVAAARRVAAVYDVVPRFAVIDFDRDDGWEDELAAFDPDIVTALNVDHWLQNPERFLSFIGRFSEVIFEGHGSAADEYRKLSRLGFKDIRLIATSERGRPVLHATK